MRFIAQFRQDSDSPDILEAFRDDIKEMRYRGIGWFPALIVRPSTGRAVLLVGFQLYKVLRDAIAHIAPDTEPVRSADDEIDRLRLLLVKHYGDGCGTGARLGNESGDENPGRCGDRRKATSIRSTLPESGQSGRILISFGDKEIADSIPRSGGIHNWLRCKTYLLTITINCLD